MTRGEGRGPSRTDAPRSPGNNAPQAYTVVRDTREQKGHGWDFPAGGSCLGTVIKTLPTADYSLAGYEDVFVLERKHSTAEIANNLIDDRFERELTRMEEYEHPIIVCEFTLDDLKSFPRGSGIPQSKWRFMTRITGAFLLKRLNEILVVHRIPIMFVGSHGQDYATSLFKRVVEHVDRPE